MKKIILTILAANMILSSMAAVSAFAENNESAEVTVVTNSAFAEKSESTGSAVDAKAMADKIKTKLNVPAELTEFKVEKSCSYKGKEEYNFRWSDKEGYNGLFVTVSFDGRIIDYNRYTNMDKNFYPYKISKMTDNEAKAIAKKWAEDIVPEYLSETDWDNAEITNEYGMDNIMVKVDRVIDGIEFVNDSITLCIDKSTNNVDSFFSNWTIAEIPDKSKAMDIEKAKEAFKKSYDAQPCYVSKDGENAELVYNINGVVINAETGEKVKTESKYDFYGNRMSVKESAASDAGGYQSLTYEEIKSLNEFEKLMTESEAEKKALALEGVMLDGFTGKRFNYYENMDGKYTLSVELKNEKGEYANVSFDAETGDLLYFDSYRESYYKNDEDDNVLKDKEQAKTIADKFVNKYYKNISDYKFDGFEDLTAVYVRYVNGIPFYDNTVKVVVTSDGKNITNYRTVHSDKMKFEEASGIISKDEAYNKIFENLGFKLRYMDIGDFEKPDAALVYSTKDNMIDAKDGSLFRSYDENKKMPTDISGHYAEEAVNTLIKNRVITLKSDTFKPDEVITQEEALEMLSVFTGVEGREVYSDFIRRRIISADEKNPTANVNRETAVKYIIMVLGFDNLEEISEDVFQPGFSDSADISKNYVRYVACAKGLGIINGDDNGKFNPQDNVTRGQFAIMIYNILTR